MSEQKQVIIDQSDLRNYRTELPNLYDDSDLSVYEYRLLGHYKRVGKCTEGLETTAKKCKMSEGMASQTRQSLAEKNFIKLERVEMDAGRYRFVVRVVDRWIENFSKYSLLSVEEIAEQLKKGSPSRGEASPSPHEASPSRGEGKKEPFKNLIHINKDFGEIAAELARASGGVLNSLSADYINTWLEKHTTEWILKAIPSGKGAGTLKYTDAVLIGWEANGYPKSREERVKGAKDNGNNGTGNKQGARPKQPKANHPAVETDAAHLAEINRRNKLRNERSRLEKLERQNESANV